MEAIEIGGQGMSSAVLLPQARREEMDLAGGVGIDALEHIDQIGRGSHALHVARGKPTRHGADRAYADFDPAKQSVPPAHRAHPHLPFTMVGIERHVKDARNTRRACSRSTV